MAEFRRELEAEDGFWAVKATCDAVLADDPFGRYWSGQPADRLIESLEDYMAFGNASLRFTEKWIEIPASSTIATNQRQDLAKVRDLIERLHASVAGDA